MSVNKGKERWLKIQENKRKCCANCSQLMPNHQTGEYICYYLKSKDDYPRGGVLVSVKDIHRVRGICFDKYNGKNI